MALDRKKLHLEFLQSAVSRMAQNSFSLKAWAVTLVSAVFALAASQSHQLFFLMCYIPLCSFWVLDAYYLRQERLFRKLYDKVRESEEDLKFSMDTSVVEDKVGSWLCVMFSVTLNIFYGIVGVAVLAVMFGLRR